MDLKDKKLLVLAPHTDDGELGCGGSIAKAIESGSHVYYAAFSTAKESVPEGMPSNILEIEVREATKRLGIASEHLKVFGYTVRKLNYSRQDILEDLVKLRNEIQPDLVFIPSLNDLHQDHSTLSMEALRAFKNFSILAYELPWNNINFTTQCFSVLEQRHLERKIEALSAYGSQKMRGYMSEEYIFSLARTRGVQIGREFAECFEVVRWIL
jgi:LmbE family N-acetylglucosaminyl deacetylase